MSYKRLGTNDEVTIAPGAVVVGDVKLGRGCSVWYNAVLRGDDGAIVVGENTNIQDCAILHEDTIVGRNCTIGHGAIVHGCTIGDNTLVGMGAIVLNGAKIGNNCLIAAGAVVTGKMDAPDGSMLMGNPAKVVREMSEADVSYITQSAEEYLAAAEKLRTELL